MDGKDRATSDITKEMNVINRFIFSSSAHESCFKIFTAFYLWVFLLMISSTFICNFFHIVPLIFSISSSCLELVFSNVNFHLSSFDRWRPFSEQGDDWYLTGWQHFILKVRFAGLLPPNINWSRRSCDKSGPCGDKVFIFSNKSIISNET